MIRKSYKTTIVIEFKVKITQKMIEIPYHFPIDKTKTRENHSKPNEFQSFSVQNHSKIQKYFNFNHFPIKNIN